MKSILRRLARFAFYCLLFIFGGCGDDATPEQLGQGESGTGAIATAGRLAAPAAGSTAPVAGTAAAGSRAAGAAISGMGGRVGAAGAQAGTGAGGAGASGTGAGGASAGGRGGAGAGSGGMSAGTGGMAGAAADSGGSGTTEKFSFFVTSFAALQKLANNQDGFGGDLRYGEADGLAGADKICREIAETALPGAGSKSWRAFLSVTKGPDGGPVHAIDRVGEGPWYDRLGRLLAASKTDLAMVRPHGADPVIANDFPNEDGVPNHAPDGMLVDNHDMLTGTNETGQLYSMDAKFTCQDWTSSTGSDGTPRVGHSWPRGGGRGGMSSGANWMSALNEAGCAAGASLIEMGGPIRSNPTVGSGGGYGGFYCFALTP